METNLNQKLFSLFRNGLSRKQISNDILVVILIVVAYDMSEWRSFEAVVNGSYFDIIILLVTFFLTVFVDLTGMRNLKDSINALHKSKVTIILLGVNNEVLTDFKEFGLTALIGESNIFDSFDGAIKHANTKLKINEINSTN